MKIILEDSQHFVLRFDKDEEVFAGLKQFMQDRQITACTFSGIGSATKVDLAFYNPFIKQYRKKPYVDEFEIISLNGTGGMLDGQPILHAHGMFGRNDFTVLGGHVDSLSVNATCEIVLIKMDGRLERKNNPDWNLNLLV